MLPFARRRSSGETGTGASCGVRQFRLRGTAVPQTFGTPSGWYGEPADGMENHQPPKVPSVRGGDSERRQALSLLTFLRGSDDHSTYATRALMRIEAAKMRDSPAEVGEE